MSGTTVACAVLRGGLMFVAGVGDSAVIVGKVDPMKGVIKHFKQERNNLSINRAGWLLQLATDQATSH